MSLFIHLNNQCPSLFHAAKVPTTPLQMFALVVDTGKSTRKDSEYT